MEVPSWDQEGKGGMERPDRRLAMSMASNAPIRSPRLDVNKALQVPLNLAPRWTFSSPEAAILLFSTKIGRQRSTQRSRFFGTDQKDRGLWGREWCTCSSRITFLFIGGLVVHQVKLIHYTILKFLLYLFIDLYSKLRTITKDYQCNNCT